MLTLFGNRCHPEAAGLSRRAFLRAGGMAAGGLTLGQLLSLEARAGTGRSHKAVINIFLPGGPPHIDTFDPKPDAPSEIRGEFAPIGTNVPGIQICELFPRMARMMDKFVLIRSLVGSDNAHDCYQCMTGRTRSEVQPGGPWPAMGAWVSRLHGPVPGGIPPHASLIYPTGHRPWGEAGAPGFVGPAHAPLQLVTKDPLKKPEGLVLQGISLERLRDRETLRRSLDLFRREADSSGVMEGVDEFNRKAMEILSTPKLTDALDLSKEDPKILERYGPDDAAPELFGGAPYMVRNFLLARRLVEAGARVVSLNFGQWDWHGNPDDGLNFPLARRWCPQLDRGLAALVSDLHERGMEKDVSVVVWGEFGRSPKINAKNSRDHWPQVSFAVLAGGGMRTGQVIGATNRKGEFATERPVTFADVFATLYHQLGIDVRTETVPDTLGRPQPMLAAGAEPIRELI